MNRVAAIILVLGIIALGAAVAYTNWRASDQQMPKAREANTGEADVATDQMESAVGPSDEGRVGEDPLAESARPDFVIYKQGEPLWTLSYDELHEHVDDLRALAGAGWGQAVLPLVRMVVSCRVNPPRSEDEILDTAPGPGSFRFPNQDRMSGAELRRRQEEASERRLDRQLQRSRRRQTACTAITETDEGRIMDWLELAVEQRHPAFLAGYLRWELLPRDDAWMVRYAERLANFNRRFEAAYLDGVYGGERGMLDLAWKLYATRKILPEPDAFLAFAFNHAAELDARERVGVTRDYMDSYRLEVIDLEPALADEARAEGERIYERCCAEARMPR